MNQNIPENVTELLDNPEAFSGLSHLVAVMRLIFGGSFSGIALMLIAHQTGGSLGDFLAVPGGGIIGIALGQRRDRILLAAWIAAGLLRKKYFTGQRIRYRPGPDRGRN